ncbi:flagellar hook-basal body complex protein [Devosia faecipullorum]|uniref:flagellar hook-basal body complex protein n=1 Tax=Devosia faecipullorum TaxID=2755039 RepID=UPI00187B2224|nr:flagellar hook-basal body complex protein [Devosia faecipullorum]MBE7732112.1 flagellar hook-basal body complex protein [Devosia faecipullorum]
MGIYGALSSAVTGLRAQAHALENISGNIANSQTVGYKRMETSFVDLIPDAPLKSQVPGAVLAQSRATNNLQGDIQTSANETYIALNSGGFFVVEPKVGQSDGNSVFAGSNFFTRRGDFEIDKDGLLVNGAGYYLKGLPIDAGTGNISGSVPEVIKLSNAFLPANVTRTINYQANLPQLPKTASYNATTPNSELLRPWSYGSVAGAPYYPHTTTGKAIPPNNTMTVPARATGANLVGTALANSVVNDADMLTVTIGGATYNLRFDTNGVANPAVGIGGATAGSATSTMRINIPSANLAALHGVGDLNVGGMPIPFYGSYSADAAGLIQAVEDTLPAGTSAVYNPVTGNLDITYSTTAWTPAASAAGAGGVSFDAAFPGFVTGSATTVLQIGSNDLAAIHAAGGFQIGNPTQTTIPFAAPLNPDGAGLVSAIQTAFPGSIANYNAGTGELSITYPPGARAADTMASAGETAISALGNINSMMSAIQNELRTLTGDSTVTAMLRNGAVEISAGTTNTQPVSFITTRNGVLTGDLLGLGAGPHNSIANGAITPENLPADLMLSNGDSLVVTVGNITRSYRFDTDGSYSTGAGLVEINAGQSLADVLADIQADLQTNGGPGAANARVTYEAGQVRISFDDNYHYDVEISGTAANTLGVAGSFQAETGELDYVSAADSDRFVSQSISGGAITVYASNGAPVNVQMRWAKVDSAAAGGTDKWQLFYLSDSTAVGGAPAWTNTGQSYEFGGNGSLIGAGVPQTMINNLSVNGVYIGNVELRHDTNGVSQFADVNGTVTVSTLNQNGYGAGEFLSVAITDAGRVVATYSNGERIEMAQVVTAQFNGVNSLKRLDGGVYQSTSESGEPIFDLSGSGIIGGALEASNTDISDEFTKLIITQQAYSAATRIVSTADEMLQEALNMVR